MAPSTAVLCRKRVSSITCGATLRFLAFSTGMALGMSMLLPTMTARAAVKPSPNAEDVERSEREAEARAAEVGRTTALLVQADGELDELAVAAEGAIERFNGERVKLERAQQAYRDGQVRLAQAGRRVEESQAELATFAAQAYQHNTGYARVPSALVGDGGPQGFMDRAGMVEVLAKQRAGFVRRVEAAQDVAEIFRKQMKAAFDEQSAATRRAQDAQRLAQEAVAQQQTSVQRIRVEKRALERRLDRAEARTAELKRARARAREEAEARTDPEDPGSAAVVSATSTERGALVARAALRWLGTPYSWGGGTTDGPSLGSGQGAGTVGFDCSGLAMYAWNQVGVRLDHWTGTQWTSGPHVPLDELNPGDLVFFARDTSNPDTIHHVGIYIGKDRMVEAPYTGARVRISSIERSDLIGATRPSG
ncbi:C40 family peptidase [Actinomadura graeca]|uniref:C40 family peptidase n=1 Tax=Actinomadura graeca TaxID=2750812 RepID=A0ABX8QXX5_9ACTN|nr:NlpC/P60 family protein [Actinomadura graeca]QXJ23478.1 C40 family peptidase [Actinomadura graeca]